MNADVQRERQSFIFYEYKELNVKEDQASFYLDCYKNFGWKQDENFPPQNKGDLVTLKLKRNRKIVNKVELTRLQRHFEADMQDIVSLKIPKQVWQRFLHCLLESLVPYLWRALYLR